MKVAEFTGLITVVLTFVIARIIAVKMVPNPEKAKNKKRLLFGKSKASEAEESEEETPVGKDVG